MTRPPLYAWAGAAVIAAGSLLVSCANRPDSIHASYVSHEKFMHLDCSGLAARMVDTRTELERNSQIQNDKANTDAVGVFLFGVPFSKLSGDVEGEIARLKGEVEAIDTVRIKRKCGSGMGAQVAAATRLGATAGPVSHPPASAPDLASRPDPARVEPPQWVAINDPGEVRALYSDTSIRGMAYGRNAQRGVPFVGQYRSDGTGVLIIEGQRIPRLWDVKGTDQVCATDPKGTNCYRLQRNANNRNEVRGQHVTSGATVRFTIQGNTVAEREADSAPAVSAAPTTADSPPLVPQPVASLRGMAAPSAPSDKSILPPAGSQWVYGFIDRQYGRRQIDVTVRVMRVNGSSIDESVAPNGSGERETQRSVSAGEARFFTHRFANGEELTEFAPYFLAVNGEKTPAIAIAATGYPVGSSSLPGFTSTAQIQGWEQVTVPAGTFRALRVEMAGNRRLDFFTRDAVAGRFKLTVWYAPEVRRFVRLEHMAWSAYRDAPAQLNHDVVELLSFRPPS